MSDPTPPNSTVVSTPADLDSIIENDVAIEIRQTLCSVLNEDGGQRLYPATFASENRNEGSNYNIDPAASPNAGYRNRCLLDSVSSQAKRMTLRLLRLNDEAEEKFLPTLTLEIEGRTVPAAALGHRVCDGSLVFAESGNLGFRETLPGKAIADFLARGDSKALGCCSPESLLFGFWDSRHKETAGKAKASRMIRSEIYAYDVERVSTGATYKAALDSAKEVFPELEGIKFSEYGLDSVPSQGAKAGVLTRREVVRSTVINLAALRRIRCKSQKEGRDAGDLEATKKIRRYLLALGLIAAGLDAEDLFLREGCLLRTNGSAVIRVMPLDTGAAQKLLTFSDKAELLKTASNDWQAQAGCQFVEAKNQLRFIFEPSKVAEKLKAEKKQKEDKPPKEPKEPKKRGGGKTAPQAPAAEAAEGTLGLV